MAASRDLNVPRRGSERKVIGVIRWLAQHPLRSEMLLIRHKFQQKYRLSKIIFNVPSAIANILLDLVQCSVIPFLLRIFLSCTYFGPFSFQWSIPWTVNVTHWFVKLNYKYYNWCSMWCTSYSDSTCRIFYYFISKQCLHIIKELEKITILVTARHVSNTYSLRLRSKTIIAQCLIM